jgi:hypothetical protein
MRLSLAADRQRSLRQRHPSTRGSPTHNRRQQTERDNFPFHIGARLISGRPSCMLGIMRTFIFFLILSLRSEIPPQNTAAGPDNSSATAVSLCQERSLGREEEARDILMGAKDALSSGNVAFLRNHLAGRVYLNLLNGTNGYYSKEQAYIILTSFFESWVPISFSFSSRNFSIANPYGFGPLNFERRGRRGMAELFLSLTRAGDHWHISQITVSAR